ncbi:MAG: hypothetical protein RLZZ488_1862 [Pseudomonadota bacterium]|jgi:spermidine/putrescine transport system permease protein
MRWTGLPAKLWIVLFVMLPFLWLLLLSLQQNSYGNANDTLGLSQFGRALSPPYAGIILSSVVNSLLAASAVLVTAIPITWYISRQSRHRQNFWLAFFCIPLGINFVVRIYAWFVLIRPEGMLTQFLNAVGYAIPLASSPAGVFISLYYGYLPLIILPLFSVFERLDQNQLDAATDLGASLFQRWSKIVLPEIIPGLIASFIFVFVPMLGEYLIPRMIGGGLVATLGTQIESQFLGSTRPNWPFGAALSVCLLTCAVLTIFIAVKMLSRRGTGQKSTWSLLQIG